MSVYKLRFGTPEEIVPSRFSPAPLCTVLEETPDGARDLRASFSRRGVKLTLPIDPRAGVYGFGLQLKGFQQRGRKKLIRPNADPLSDSGDSHAPVPFFVTTAGFGLYVDTARYVTFDCGKVLRGADGAGASDEAPSANCADLYAVRNTGDQTLMTIEIPCCDGVDLYYITGDDILSIVSQYNLLSGGGCMPSLWGLGCFYRCDTHFRDEQIVGMAKHFRDLHIPCDIIGVEPGWQSKAYSCSFVWDPARFPDPDKTMGELAANGFHVNLWEHAFVHPSAPFHDKIKPYSGDYLVWGGLVPDFTLPEARKVFAQHHRGFAAQGVSGFKLDECDGSDFTGGWTFPNCAMFPSGADGEQYHNLFGTLYARAIQESLDNRRTLSEVRNLGALAASYPFVLYSDLYDHKDFLTGLVNAGFSGLLWTPEVRHAENAEDLIRRVQTVIFSAQALVNCWYLDTMPWEMHGCTDAIRDLFRWRMALVPYLYNAFYDYHMTGKPPVRALVCDYTDDAVAQEVKDEYLFGDAMLVAPLTAPDKERDVYLPAGVWYDLFTGERYAGGVTHHRVTDGIPVYVKAGTLLPLAEPVDYIAQDTVFRITLRAYGDCTGSTCRLIEDDGETYTTDYRTLTVGVDGRIADNRRYTIEKVESVQ